MERATILQQVTDCIAGNTARWAGQRSLPAPPPAGANLASLITTLHWHNFVLHRLGSTRGEHPLGTAGPTGPHKEGRCRAIEDLDAYFARSGGAAARHGRSPGALIDAVSQHALELHDLVCSPRGAADLARLNATLERYYRLKQRVVRLDAPAPASLPRPRASAPRRAPAAYEYIDS